LPRFPGETCPDNNSIGGSARLTVQGGGLYTVGFPVKLNSSLIKHNTPDQCYGC